MAMQVESVTNIRCKNNEDGKYFVMQFLVDMIAVTLIINDNTK